MELIVPRILLSDEETGGVDSIGRDGVAFRSRKLSVQAFVAIEQRLI